MAINYERASELLLEKQKAMQCDEFNRLSDSVDKLLSSLVGAIPWDWRYNATHWAMNVKVGGVRLVNLGSVSNPCPPDLRASYVVLSANDSCHSLWHRRVDYDRDAVIADVTRIKHPAGDYIIGLMRGQNKPPWRKKDEPPWL